jgi:hypothetical protein
MSGSVLGQDYCGDRYPCNSTHKCACCGVCFCLSCYRVHCTNEHEKRVGKPTTTMTTWDYKTNDQG